MRGGDLQLAETESLARGRMNPVEAHLPITGGVLGGCWVDEVKNTSASQRLFLKTPPIRVHK